MPSDLGPGSTVDSVRLPRAFYDRDTLQVARELLGQRLVRVLDGQRLSGRIVETEAYIGTDDRACHASRGRTPRTEVMFGAPGHAYVYLIYGMHHCLNVVTERREFPAAVLIRALEPVEGLSVMRGRRPTRCDRELTSGPGKLCQALHIDRRLNGADLCGADLFIEAAPRLAEALVLTTPRIGIAYAGDSRELPWRFLIRDHPSVSRKR
jgi:DNA-3-methyladenine glycosylase